MPATILTVDEFVEKRLRPIVEMLRALIREAVPEAREMISYGIPMYKAHKHIVVISPTKNDITFSFTHGTEFEDKYDLLRGVGKVSRHIKIKRLNSVSPTALRYYIKQALRRDREAARPR
jgi:uncharacterized protein YdhG (YjbR/CyaY superfamily)